MADTAWQVLVVEDEFDSVQVVSKILTFHGIEVHVAHNGVECMKQLKHLRPTLILTDLAMPEMDGWRTLAAIRENPATQHIPVVAMTAYHSVDLAEEARAAGFDAYFAKPVNAMRLVDDLGKIIAG
jgi:CheY-like chemotaxis protein